MPKFQGEGTAYKDNPIEETWQPTMHLAFFEIDGKKILHQQWASNIGRRAWRPVPECNPTDRDLD